jgi:hypothetical protein
MDDGGLVFAADGRLELALTLRDSHRRDPDTQALLVRIQ